MVLHLIMCNYCPELHSDTMYMRVESAMMQSGFAFLRNLCLEGLGDALKTDAIYCVIINQVAKQWKEMNPK